MKQDILLPIVSRKYNLSYIIFDEDFKILDFSLNMREFVEDDLKIELNTDIRDIFWEFVGLENDLKNLVDLKKRYIHIPLISRNSLFYDINIELCEISNNKVFIAMFSKQLSNSLNYLKTIQKINQNNLEKYYKEESKQKYYNLINEKLISFNINHLGNITKVNNACSFFLGVDKQALIGKHFSNYFFSRENKVNISANSHIFRAINFANKEIFFHADIIPISSKPKSEKIVICQDITYLKKIETELEYVVNHDSLTGLPNRLFLKKKLESCIERYNKDKEIFAICFIDLNKFKEVNDTYGHHVGDMLLKHLADVLQGVVRENDVVARLGGDEFIILLKNLDSIEYLDRTINRIKEVSKNSPMHYNEKLTIEISFSFGISVYPYDGNDIDTLIDIADKNMYESKKRAF